VRHSWRLDAKWAVGLLFVLCAAAASITYSLHRISAQEPQVQPDYAVHEGFATSGGDELPSIGPGGVPQA
jgi:hypothetical protein